MKREAGDYIEDIINAMEKRDCDAALFKSTQVRDFILVGTIKVDEDEN